MTGRLIAGQMLQITERDGPGGVQRVAAGRASQDHEALDIPWAMTGADHYRLSVAERNWSANRFEAWLGETLERFLLR